MKILLRFYNAVNLGDDLFVKIITERYPEHSFMIPIYGTSTLPPLGKNAKLVRVPIARRWFAALGYLINFANIQLLAMSRECDAMVYIGGSIFIESKRPRVWIGERKFYKTIKIPYFILGANIGPYQDYNFLVIVKSILSGAADACLRDSASFDLVKDLPNVRQATDIAFLLDETQYSVKNENIAVISLVDGTRKFSDEITSKYEDVIREMTIRLLADGFRVVYMSFCKHEGDEVANYRVLGGLSDDVREKVEIHNYHGDLESALWLLSSSEVVIASRFHATILGLIFSKKVLPMAYSDKTIAILKDISFSGQVIDIRLIEKFDVSSFSFDKIPRMNIAEQRVLAREQFHKLDKMLDGKE